MTNGSGGHAAETRSAWKDTNEINRVDGDWAAWGTPLPIIPGHEVTGIVEKIGKGVTAFAPG